MNLFNGRLNVKRSPYICCKECGGLMQPEVPRDPKDNALHSWCGYKLQQRNNNALLPLQTANSAPQRLL